MFVAVDQQFAGLIAVSDPIKESTAEAVKSLHDLGLRIIMLTGDNEKTAETVANKLGIDEFHAGVQPEDKHERIRSLKAGGRKVAMAGDGGRWHQRCSCFGRGGCRDCNGDRNRCGH